MEEKIIFQRKIDNTWFIKLDDIDRSRNGSREQLEYDI